MNRRSPTGTTPPSEPDEPPAGGGETQIGVSVDALKAYEAQRKPTPSVATKSSAGLRRATGQVPSVGVAKKTSTSAGMKAPPAAVQDATVGLGQKVAAFGEADATVSPAAQLAAYTDDLQPPAEGGETRILSIPAALQAESTITEAPSRSAGAFSRGAGAKILSPAAAAAPAEAPVEEFTGQGKGGGPVALVIGALLAGLLLMMIEQNAGGPAPGILEGSYLGFVGDATEEFARTGRPAPSYRELSWKLDRVADCPAGECHVYIGTGKNLPTVELWMAQVNGQWSLQRHAIR